jgi:uncharacterized membrane protein
MERTRPRDDLTRAVLRWLLAGFMLFAGVSHLVAAEAFLGQVPAWLPLRTAIVWVSGVIEIGFGLALLLLPDRRRQVGRALAVFFVLVFPGNLYQAIAGTNAFGLDTPIERWGRLAIQPLLIVWALWSADAIPRAVRPGTSG